MGRLQKILPRPKAFSFTCFQQDSATSHNALANIAFLETFGTHLISLKANFSYPAQPPHLTTSEACVWEVLKKKILREDPPATIFQLEENKPLFKEFTEGGTTHLHHNMIQNLHERHNCCLKLNERYIEHVLTLTNAFNQSSVNLLCSLIQYLSKLQSCLLWCML